MPAKLIEFAPRHKARARYTRPRQRVFYAGYRYTGPALCQDLQDVFLKRHANDEWSLIFYYQRLSYEIDRFSSADVLDKLDEHQIEGSPEPEELFRMGWRGGVVEVVDFKA